MNTPVVKEKGSMFKKVLGNQISVVFFILIESSSADSGNRYHHSGTDLCDYYLWH